MSDLPHLRPPDVNSPEPPVNEADEVRASPPPDVPREPEAWLRHVAAGVTDRAAVAEFVPESRSDMWMSSSRVPPHWRVVIKGVEPTAYIDSARVTLRDDEHVRARVLRCLPESERTK